MIVVPTLHTQSVTGNVTCVVARNVDDVNLFMENLEKTGAFSSLISREEHFNEQGLLEATLETNYVLMAKPSGRRGAVRR